MPVNRYFHEWSHTNEQSLQTDLVEEAIQTMGLNAIFIPRDEVNEDYLFGEDTLSEFDSPSEIAVYLENIEGFEGQDIMERFGLVLKEQVTFIISKKEFARETRTERPNEGDLLFFPMTQGFFEITKVESDIPFYQLGKNYVFQVRCELFSFSEETIETGYDDIDALVQTAEQKAVLGLTGAVGTFTIGSGVFTATDGTTGNTGSGIFATIQNYTGGNTMILRNRAGNWLPSDSSTTRYVYDSNGSYAEIESFEIDQANRYEEFDNNFIDTEADLFTNFDEDNPFGVV